MAGFVKGFFGLGEKIIETPYKVLQSWEEENVELREYEATEWVANGNPGTIGTKEARDGFFKNFKYIQDQRIAMTAPVLFAVDENADVRTKAGDFKICFYIDKNEVANPPKPNDETVELMKLPPMKLYVRKFGGYMTNDSMHNEAKALREALTKLGLKYHENSLYCAGYDPPGRFWGRRNEVMFKVQE